jgi:PLP dependent protein
MFQYEKAWQAVMARIGRAAALAGRSPESVRLLAVSKTFPAQAVRAVHALGQRAVGENYVQEALAKMETLTGLPDLEWHLIGPLQSNKTGLVAARFAWVHSIDREKIAARLSAARPVSCAPLNVCVQVNISGEASKGGVAPGQAVALGRAVAALPRLRLRGVMGIPEPDEDLRTQRLQFGRLRECYDACRAAGLAVDTLSMGMSADLEVAIAEGATMVRVGSALFGARPASSKGTMG